MKRGGCFFFLTLALLLMSIACATSANNPATMRNVQCSMSNMPVDETFNEITAWSERLATSMSSEKAYEKGYSGNIAIVGGAPEDFQAAYLAAMAALRVGADSVEVYSWSTVGDMLKSFSPDINVIPTVDTGIDSVITLLSKADAVVLGPGLDASAHTITHVLPKVINHCKTTKKPLVLDLPVELITQATVNLLLNYPEPGVVLTPNHREFEKLYTLIQSTNAPKNGDLQIDYKKYGDNLYVLRKNCVDVGLANNATATWIMRDKGCAKRSSGQGHMLAGALGTFFMWANKALPAEVVGKRGPSFRAGVAAYAAAHVVRETCELAYNANMRGLVTSDMIDRIHNVMYETEARVVGGDE